jgi:predicted RNA binding protein YcfA (HicA-like mRNA interferase family)
VPKLPRVSGRECIRALERLGFRRVRQRGSHVVMRRARAGDVATCVVPVHDLLDPGILRSILRQARVSVEEFVEALG